MKALLVGLLLLGELTPSAQGFFVPPTPARKPRRANAPNRAAPQRAAPQRAAPQRADTATTREEQLRRRKAGLIALKELATIARARRERRSTAATKSATKPTTKPATKPAIERQTPAKQNPKRERDASSSKATLGSLLETTGQLALARMQLSLLDQRARVQAGMDDLLSGPASALEAAKRRAGFTGTANEFEE